MIIALSKAFDLKIFSPTEPIGIVILILGLMFFRNLVFEMFAPGLFLR